MTRPHITGSGALIHRARWIKPDDRQWMRHDIAPATTPYQKVGLAWQACIWAGLLIGGAVLVPNVLLAVLP